MLTHRWTTIVPLLVVIAGCGQSGPQIAPVHGRVTLDGKPLAEADIRFEPDGQERASIGHTGNNGRYELIYKRGQPGAVVGQHTVRIWVSKELVRNPPVIAGRFNSKSELRSDVKPKLNEFDFDVTTEGK